jgi:hypothetical protein
VKSSLQFMSTSISLHRTVLLAESCRLREVRRLSTFRSPTTPMCSRIANAVMAAVFQAYPGNRDQNAKADD